MSIYKWSGSTFQPGMCSDRNLKFVNDKFLFNVDKPDSGPRKKAVSLGKGPGLAETGGYATGSAWNYSGRLSWECVCWLPLGMPGGTLWSIA